jgi:ssDNA-binding Zn-finger/Zn-ribbon topoisomerase 1
MSDQSNKIEYRCPKCNRLLYDRKHKKCGWCGADLPEELLFTKEEIDKMEKESAELEEQRRLRKIREDKEKEERKCRDQNNYNVF